MTRDGRRPGAGRPPSAGTPQTKRLGLRLTEAERGEIRSAVPDGTPIGRWVVAAALNRARSMLKPRFGTTDLQKLAKDGSPIANDIQGCGDVEWMAREILRLTGGLILAGRSEIAELRAALVPCPCGGSCNCDWCGGVGRLTKRALEAIQRDEDPE